MVRTPAALSAVSFSIASAILVSSSHSSDQLAWLSGVRTNTCSCMSVVPSSAVGTGPRTVSTSVTVAITPPRVWTGAPHCQTAPRRGGRG